MHFSTSSIASLVLVASTGVLASFPASNVPSFPASSIPSADVVNQVKDVIGQYSLAVDSKNWDFSNFCSSKSWYSNYAGLNTTNLTVFEQGHATTLPANTASQHLMDTKFVYQGNDSVITARTYVTATVFQQGTNASFADYNVYDDKLRMEDGSWKIFSRNATALFATGDPSVIGHASR